VCTGTPVHCAQRVMRERASSHGGGRGACLRVLQYTMHKQSGGNERQAMEEGAARVYGYPGTLSANTQGDAWPGHGGACGECVRVHR